MSSDEPAAGDWASPGGPPPPPAYGAAQGAGGWSTTPPAPPPYGWSGPPQGWAARTPKPGVIPLRPLGVGEMLDGSFATIRRYPAATLGLAAVVILIVELIQVPVSYYLLHGVTTDVGDRVHTVTSITDLLSLLSTVLLSGMLTTVVGQAVLGRPMSIGDAWRATRPLLWRLLGATLLIVLIAAGIVLVGALPGIVIAIAGAHDIGIGTAVIGGLAGSIFAIYISIALSFTTPVLVLEKQGIRASLRRSRALVKGTWWRVFGIFLLASVIGAVIAAIIVVPFSFQTLSSILSGHAGEQYRFTPLLLTGIGTLIASTLVRPFTAGVIALLYLDRRMRAEALDLTLQQSAANNPS
jgi:hypothetical protein